jgi:hypothetical protein
MSAYIRLDKGLPAEWPILDFQMRSYLKLVSLPVDLSKADLAVHGFERFAHTAIPEYDEVLQYVEEVSPIKNTDGVWTQTYRVVDKYQTHTEKQAALDKHNKVLQAEEEAKVRHSRNQLLFLSDWTQISDAQVDKALWATYRQQLRDITLQQEFPWKIIWPIKP